MSSIRLLGDAEIHGNLLFAKQVTDFPENPSVGIFVIKDRCLYGYLKIGDLETWYPFASKTNSYIHMQEVPALTWVVNHNLGTTNLWFQVTGPDGNTVSVGKVDVSPDRFSLSFTEANKGICLVVAPDSIDVPQVKASLIRVGTGVQIDTSGVYINGNGVLTSASIAADIAAAVAPLATSANLSSEVSRAQGVESTLSAALTTEVSRARSAESDLAAALTTEESRAQAAEGALVESLVEEIERAKAAEIAILSSRRANVLTTDALAKNLTLAGDLLPAMTGVSRIGTAENKFAAIYAQELYLDASTLYVDGVPVLQSAANTIRFEADLNQGMLLQASGTGHLTLSSGAGTVIQATGQNGDVLVQAGGQGGQARVTATAAVVLTAPSVQVAGNGAVSGDLVVSGNLAVAGTVTHVDTVNMAVKDNIIDVNAGEAGEGVTRRYAGIQVDRGDLPNVRLVWDEVLGKLVFGVAGSETVVADVPVVQAAVSGALGALATVASSGRYSDLSGKPAIPTATSQLVNDEGFLTAETAPVVSVAGRTGAVTLSRSDVGLGDVDNTADAAKAVASAARLTTPRTIAGVSFDGSADIAIPFGNVSGLQAALDGKQAVLGFTPENAAHKGIPGGYAGLDAAGRVPYAALPKMRLGLDPA